MCPTVFLMPSRRGKWRIRLLLCYVVQLRWYHSRRKLGRSILGRFWGWDPKENGALLIVMWNAIILHSRWDGFIRERGLAVMSVFGNIVFSLSWFGVNMLGVGLHSYGFMDRAFGTLLTFIAGQLVVMALDASPEILARDSNAGATSVRGPFRAVTCG
jgi:hypothetical protein